MIVSLAHITAWLFAYPYVFLFPLVVVEGPIVTVIAGFLISTGSINPYMAYGMIVIADLVGDSVYYVLGRWGKYIGVKPERVAQIESHFANHAVKTLMIGKLTHAIGSVILFAAGVARVPYMTFIWANLIPTLPKTLALLVLGYYFGQAYMTINTYFEFTTLVMGIVTVVSIFIYRIAKKRQP